MNELATTFKSAYWYGTQANEQTSKQACEVARTVQMQHVHLDEGHGLQNIFEQIYGPEAPPRINQQTTVLVHWRVPHLHYPVGQIGMRAVHCAAHINQLREGL